MQHLKFETLDRFQALACFLLMIRKSLGPEDKKIYDPFLDVGSRIIIIESMCSQLHSLRPCTTAMSLRFDRCTGPQAVKAIYCLLCGRTRLQWNGTSSFQAYCTLMRRGDGVVTCDKNFRSGRADGLQRFCDTAKLRMVYLCAPQGRKKSNKNQNIFTTVVTSGRSLCDV
ncbi:hypothetical protein BC629DRAFT_1448822 [Irpex lacteus]|nr:hypothetical protein BC629DRAFT_1448822 [Irpex lacteus]